MNIFLRELKANLQVAAHLGRHRGPVRGDGDRQVLRLLQQPGDADDTGRACRRRCWPPSTCKAFNLTTISGFFGIMFTYFALLLSIAATMWGSDIISKEERDKTVEFSLTLPVTRSRVVTAKTPGGAGQLRRLAAHHLGRVASSARSATSPTAASTAFLALCMAGALHPAAGLPGHRHLPGLRHEAVQAGQLAGRVAAAGDLFPLRHHRPEQEPGLPEVLHALQVLRPGHAAARIEVRRRSSWGCRSPSSWRAWWAPT